MLWVQGASNCWRNSSRDRALWTEASQAAWRSRAARSAGSPGSSRPSRAPRPASAAASSGVAALAPFLPPSALQRQHSVPGQKHTLVQSL